MIGKVLQQSKLPFLFSLYFSLFLNDLHSLAGLVNSRGNSPERGKGNSLLPVALCYHIRKFVPRSGCKSAIFGYVWKNVPVQEDINPSIYLI